MALLEVLGGNGAYLSSSALVIFVCGLIVANAVIAGTVAFFAKRGETAAIKRDLETIKNNLAQTTTVTEEIKATISQDLWLRQKKWNAKWECYTEIVEQLGEVHACIQEAIPLRDGGQPIGVDQKREEANLAFQKVRRAGSKARLAVSSEVRTALSRFGEKWNASQSLEDQTRITRDAWMEIADIGRHDLYGEPREMREGEA